MRHYETCHASVRRQGHTIPPFDIDLLMEHGSSIRICGADIYFMNKDARRRTKRLLGDRIHAALEQYLDAYVVCPNDGRIITAAWRRRRFRQH